MITPEQQAVVDLRARGLKTKEIAEQLGITPKAAENRLARAQKWLNADPGVKAAMAAANTNIIPSTIWTKVDAEGNVSYSVMTRPDELTDFREVIRDTMSEIAADVTLHLPKRFTVEAGNLGVLDPADVHIGKLSTETETGVTYDEAVAEHRLVEGSRLLLEKMQREGVTRVMFVIGNDIAHTDDGKGTTSGTPQDSSVTWFTMYRIAQRSYVRIVRMMLEMGLEVIPVFNPSNHDWRTGYAIAQSVGLLFERQGNVMVSDYNLSERHRKYLRFERNLIATSHGDGAREQDLPQLAQVEARGHLDGAPLQYWYVHHYHHKIRKQRGLSESIREKDHISMTAIHSGLGNTEGHNTQIEYVRSPSAPDSWHHRNGYLNRQAVEAFVHHPYEGQVSRFTEWF